MCRSEGDLVIRCCVGRWRRNRQHFIIITTLFTMVCFKYQRFIRQVGRQVVKLHYLSFNPISCDFQVLFLSSSPKWPKKIFFNLCLVTIVKVFKSPWHPLSQRLGPQINTRLEWDYLHLGDIQSLSSTGGKEFVLVEHSTKVHHQQ